MAAIRGDRSAAERWRAASILVDSHSVQSDGDLKLLLETLPRSTDAELQRELQQIAEDGAAAVLGASIGELPPDLRWLVEAGDVTVGEFGILHDVLAVTRVTDLAAEVRCQSIRHIRGLGNPFVTIVTHPTDRQFSHRRGYEIDYDRLFAAAVETRTALEIDGGPGHLDLDSGLARRAIAAGATVSIDSDAHGAAILGRQMRLGLLTARGGWVEPRHVLNARPIADVLEWIRTKRAGSPSNA